ncbi:MAG: hypothetical protein GY774_03530, partial [Planctomycetes bacterium]|nr:hypothetical protein [Planctomycetota bacterium]
MNIDNWLKHKHVLTEPEVIDYLAYGFPIGFNYEFHPTPTFNNHKSAREYPDHIEQYIQTELDYGAMAGPFDQIPFTWFMCSPLMTGDKNEGKDRRIIMDLSYPPKASVNDGIPKDTYMGLDYKLQLPTIFHLRDAIRCLGKGTLLWSKDFSRAFRQLRVDPTDYPLLGLTHSNSYFFDLAPPFGVRMGSKCCHQVATAIVDIMRAGGFNCLAYIDDLAGYSDNMDKAQAAADRCENLLHELGIEESKHKATPPKTNMTWLGVSFDTQLMIMYIPRKKIDKVAALVDDWMGKEHCLTKQLQQLLGRLFHVGTCNPTMRLFTNRMLKCLGKSESDHDTLQITEEFRLDLKWVKRFLRKFNGVHIITPAPTFPSSIIVDSCLSGAGGHLGGLWFRYEFPNSIMDKGYSISILEMINLMVAVKIFSPHLHGHVVDVYCDNLATVNVLQGGKGKCEEMLACAREIWFCSALKDIQLRVHHIDGAAN